MVKQDYSTRLSSDPRASFPVQPPNQFRPYQDFLDIGKYVFSPHTLRLSVVLPRNLKLFQARRQLSSPPVVSPQHICYSFHVGNGKTFLKKRKTH
jgi:hypothetical protein